MRKLSLLVHSLFSFLHLLCKTTVACTLDACTHINTHTQLSEVACDARNMKWSMSKGQGRCQAQGPQRVGDRREEASEDDVRQRKEEVYGYNGKKKREAEGRESKTTKWE